MNEEIATLGGGCFWCLEAVYRDVHGVLGVESGYMGGQTPNPSYRDVCTGTTGHIEVVQIRFDSQAITYGDLLQVFFAIHDPTSRDRQGNDIGSQYRSVIFTHSAEQRATAEDMIRRLEASGAFEEPIVTEIRPAQPFYRAEEYHQGYYDNNSDQPYCTYVITPKIRKFRQLFSSRRQAAS